MPEGGAEAESVAEARLVEAATAVIRKGSLSFSLAARLLGRKDRHAIILLYAWFRHCDDLVDAQHQGYAKTAEQPASIAALEDLRAKTRAALAGGLANESCGAFAGLARLAKNRRVPEHCFEEFLDGMEFDVNGGQVETFSDLKLYCYRVAGTVGLIFAHIVGVSDAAALRRAVHLGIAMQLTNIARDVAEDHAAGRCYLPTRWLERSGVRCADVADPQHRAAVFRIVHRLVKVADRYYQSGDLGIDKLSFRAALAVGAARRIYAEIGRLIIMRGTTDLSRVVVSGPRKVWLLVKAAAAVAYKMPKRLVSPWRASSIPSSWRFI